VIIPEYNSYVNACVDHTINGTIISTNLAALVINYAALNGNAVITRQMSTYNIKMADLCATGNAYSTSLYSELLSSLVTTNRSLAVSPTVHVLLSFFLC